MINITERKQAVKELRKNEELLRRYYDNTLIGMAIIDVDKRFIQVNETLCDMTGYSREELMGMKWEELTYPDDLEAAQEKFKRILAGEFDSYVMDKRYIRKNRQVIHISVSAECSRKENGEVAYFAAFLQDITERKQLDEALRKSEEILRRYYDTKLIGMAIVDVDKNFTQVNETFCDMTGYSREELLDMKWEDLTYPDTLETDREKFKQVLAGEIDSYVTDKRYIRKDRQIIHISVCAECSRKANGEVAYFAAFVQDITERKKAENNVRNSRERLRKLATKLQVVQEEERTRIAREIHDELGQGLTGLRIDISWILEQLPKNNKDLIDRTKISLQLVDQTLRSVQSLSQDLRPPLLDDLGLESAIEWQVKEFRRRTECYCNLDMDLIDLETNNNRDTAIFRVVQESLTNVMRHAQASEVNISVRTKDGWLLLEIMDNGRGISAQELENFDSTGLIGMRERAGMLGGRVEIQRQQSGGTVVRLKLPVQHEHKTAEQFMS